MSSCSFNDLICHRSEAGCHLKVNEKHGIFHHVFHSTAYSIWNNNPLITFIPELKNSVLIENKSINKLKGCIQSSHFTLSEYTHIFNYVVKSSMDYWNIIYNIIDFWTTIMQKINILCGEQYYPNNISVCDVLISKNTDYKLVFLRPTSFVFEKRNFYSAIQDLMKYLFVNSLTNAELNKTPKVRSKLKCPYGNCQVPKRSSGCLNDLYKKSNAIHDIFCININYLNTEWFNYILSYVKYRYLGADDYNKYKNKVEINKEQKQCINLRNIWRQKCIEEMANQNNKLILE
jgi:hypothetical protein